MTAPACDGTAIGVIKNYKGLNTSCGDERILHRIDGRHSKLSSTTALPNWIGPGYYDNSQTSTDSTTRPDSSFQVSFRNTGRIIKNAEHHKEARFEQLSKSASFSLDDNGPGYSRPSTCGKGHNDMDISDFLVDNPWSASSAQSTIGRASSQSGRQSPQKVFIHSPKKTVCAYESVISDFIGLSAEQSSLNSIGMDDSVNLNTLDSLVIKAADMDKRKYLNSDFAMGGLDLQSDIPMMTLDESGEVVLGAGAGAGKTLRPLTNTKKTPHHKSKGVEMARHKRSKAQKVLNTIKHDLAQNRTSSLRDQNVSFTDSLSYIIDDWQTSENVPSPSKYVKHGRKNKTAITPNVNAVNLDQLLMDDSGMSYEEAKCLVEEYSASLQSSHL